MKKLNDIMHMLSWNNDAQTQEQGMRLAFQTAVDFIRRKMKKTISLLIIAILLIACTSCNGYQYEYTGENAGLYTVAVNSLLGARGFKSGDVKDPLIEIMEEDDYGRIMFLYYEGIMINNYDYALIIVQKIESDYVYYYPDYNFIVAAVDYTSPQDKTTQDYEYVYYYPQFQYRAKFKVEQVNKLKEDNDWNKEPDENKCFKQAVINEKVSPLQKKEQRELHSELFKNEKPYSESLIIFLTQDNFGRSVYFVRSNWTRAAEFMIIIIYPNGEKKSIKLVNYYNYQDELKAFKEQNNWNKP